MKRHVVTKLQLLGVRHPGLIEKVGAMFEEFWPTQEVRHMIQAQYGERLSLNTVARYKRKHWQAQRELVQQASATLAAGQAFAGGARLGVRLQQLPLSGCGKYGKGGCGPYGDGARAGKAVSVG